MSLIPYQVADRIEYDVLICTGQNDRKPIVTGNEPLDNVLDVLLRSDPDNANIVGYDADTSSQWIFIGSANSQVFPLKADQSINFRVKRRNEIYFRGPVGHKLIVLTAKRIIESSMQFNGR